MSSNSLQDYQRCSIPLAPGLGLSRDGAQLRTQCRDRIVLPAAGCSPVLQLGGVGAAGPAPYHDTAAPLSRGICTCTGALGQLRSRDGFSLTAVPAVRRGWERSPVPWQERGEPASVPPAARPGICSLLRQTAREGLHIVGHTLASAQSHQQEPPHQAPTLLRPRQTALCETNRAQGLRESCRS